MSGEPMSDERRAQIKAATAVRIRVGDGPLQRAARDSADLLAEIDRLRSVMTSERITDERRAEIVWRSERVGSQHWIKRAVADLLAEVDRLTADNERMRPVFEAAIAWWESGADVVSADAQAHRGTRNLRRAVRAALASGEPDTEAAP